MDRRKFISLLTGTACLGIAGKIGFELTAKSEIIDTAKKSLGGKRWAMAIDLFKLKKNNTYFACIEACHNAHNVPDIRNPKHEIKWIWREKFKHAFIEQEHKNLPEKITSLPVLLLCNHCNRPPCVNVCPTKATWRRDDGIVMMDWHRCIGCRYCIAACPYGSRSFNFVEPKPHIHNIIEDFPARTRGVVEKCTFCAEYIVKGEYIKLPDCVTASKGAIVFGNLNDKNSEVYKVLTTKFSIRRKPELSTEPEVYYIIEDEEV